MPKAKNKTKRPNLTGTIQKGRDTIGKIALWEQVSDNEKFPKYKGVITVGSDKTYVSLWAQGA